MPTEVTSGPGLFDRLASHTATLVSRAWFFTLCVLMVLTWFPTLFLMPIDSSQLIINTTTTIITFLLVALLENTSHRADAALQRKLNAIAGALVDLLEEFDGTDADITQLEAAVGLELRENTSG